MTAINSPDIRFLDFHQPPLKTGEYTLKVEQTVQLPGGISDHWTIDKKILVASERYHLPPQSIHSQFPPDGNQGDHSNVLPHIMLHRSTLPWERLADKQNLKLPWLWLFVFDEDDIAAGRVKILENQPIAKIVHFVDDLNTEPTHEIELEREPGDGTNGDNTHVDVLRLKKDWVEQSQVIPTANALDLMTHVRSTEGETDPEVAACVANRLPTPGKKSYAHLLSLENRFKTESGQSIFRKPDSTSDGDHFTFISLCNWSFNCPETDRGTKGTFKGLVGGLKSGNFKLEPSNLDNSTPGKAYIEKGAVILPHHLRTGGQTLSWYSGPLINHSTPDETEVSSLSVRASDQLLRFDKKLAMLDTSYATAWELGRMLTLNDKVVSAKIHACKKQRKWRDQQDLLHGALSHLEMNQGLPKPEHENSCPEELKTWFSGLSLLKGIPFNYLVPNEKLLPEESIRFFQLDKHWISCLLDGSMSIGRVTKKDHGSEKRLRTAIDEEYDRDVTGVLIRSSVIAGWPGLKIQASSAATFTEEELPETKGSLPPLRTERLGPDVLIYLFKGELKTIDIHLKAENLHFGFDRPSRKHPNYYKDLKDLDTGKLDQNHTTIISWLNKDHRLVDMEAMSKGIREKFNPEKTQKWSAAQFALQMVEGIPRTRFCISDE